MAADSTGQKSYLPVGLKSVHDEYVNGLMLSNLVVGLTLNIDRLFVTVKFRAEVPEGGTQVTRVFARLWVLRLSRIVGRV